MVGDNMIKFLPIRQDVFEQFHKRIKETDLSESDALEQLLDGGCLHIWKSIHCRLCGAIRHDR